MLNAPLPGDEKKPVTPDQAEDEGAAFMALMNAPRPA